MSRNLMRANASVPATNRASPTQQKLQKYTPAEMINTTDIAHYFFPLFYAGERGTLGMWEKQTGLGHIKRRVENEGRKFHVLEMVNPHSNTGTFITIPKTEWQALHVTLPHFVMIVRNFRRNFSFDILVLDNKGHRRRFSFATWFNPSNLKKFPFLCQVPLKLDLGWNEVHIDLEDLVRTTYKSRYVETIRLQVNANCRLRQIFFCDDTIINSEMPIPSMKMFENMKLLTTEFGPLNHPDYLETGPERKRDHVLPEPPTSPPVSRIEKDINKLQVERFKELTSSNSRPVQSHYKTYFRNLLLEPTTSKSLAAKGSKNAVQAGRINVVVSEDLELENEADEERQGVSIPLDMKQSINLMELITKGKQLKTPSGSTTRANTSAGQYYPPTSPPPTATGNREQFYFRPATPFPPPN